MVAEHLEDEVSAYIKKSTSAGFTFAVIHNRLALIYKRLPYRVEYVSYPDIEPTFKRLGVPPTSDKAPQYTLPSMYIRS